MNRNLFEQFYDLWLITNGVLRWAIVSCIGWFVIILLISLVSGVLMSYIAVIVPALALIFLLLAYIDPLLVEALKKNKESKKLVNLLFFAVVLELLAGIYLRVIDVENMGGLFPVWLGTLVGIGIISIILPSNIESSAKKLRTVLLTLFVLLTIYALLPKTGAAVFGFVGKIDDVIVGEEKVDISIPTPSNISVQQHQESVVEQQKYKETIFLKSGEIWVSEKVFKAGDVICIKTDNECLYLDSSDNGYVVKKSISGTKYITKTRDGTISFLSSTPTRIEISQYN